MDKERARKIQIHEERKELVVKSNDLIRNARYVLSEQEQKILIYLISKIDRDDIEIKSHKISLKDYCEVAGIPYKNGGNKEQIKASLKSLRDKSWWIKTGAKKEILFSWITEVEINGEIAEIELSQKLAPYLLQLKADFTKYELIEVLMLKGKYTIRLYELLKSYLWQHELNISVSELRDIINCHSYQQFKEFKRNVLSPALKEINDYTALQIEYKTITYRRKIENIVFQIGEKEGYQLGMQLYYNKKQRLNRSEETDDE